MDIAKKISNWLVNLALRINGTDRRNYALEVLGIDQLTLLNAQQMYVLGTDPFCRKQLGLTRGDLALLRKSRGRRVVSAATTIEGVAIESSFNRFAEWVGKAYTAARSKNRGRWKSQGEDAISREIRNLAKQHLDDQTLKRLVINAFYLYWIRHIKASITTKNKSA